MILKHFWIYIIPLFILISGCGHLPRTLWRNKASIEDVKFFSYRNIPIREKNTVSFNLQYSSYHLPAPKEWVWSKDTAQKESILDLYRKTGTKAFLIMRHDSILYEYYEKGINAEDLLSTLIFQNHNPISTPSDLDRDQVNFVVDEQTNNFGDSIAALSFYTSFSNPDMPNYTWNRSFSNSNDAFSGGNLAIYFGKASEIGNIRNKNPNLYFDVAPILASDDVNVGNKTKATIYVMSLVKNSKNLAGGFAAINYLTNSDSQKFWATLSGLPPARRDLLSTAPNDPFQSVFYASAIRSETWLNPDPDQSSLAFQDMIESVSTGKQKANEVITPFASRLRNMYLTK